LSVDEILRTYLFCWLFAPGIVAGPVIVLLSRADDISWPVLALVGLVILWLVLAIALVVFLFARYRERWAPLREVRWMAPPQSA
jgi:hypothetical protein